MYKSRLVERKSYNLSTTNYLTYVLCLGDQGHLVEVTNIDEDYIQTNLSDNSSKRNLTKLPTLASVCDRYGVSSYAGAAIASATLVNYAIITKVDKSQVIGPQKLEDERRRCREERRKAELADLKELTSFYFDGKKTMTRVLVKNNKKGRWNSTIKVDDHYVVLTEPGNDYSTHVTPKTGHGKVVARAMYDFLVEHELTNQPLYVAGCDNCRVNTGPRRCYPSPGDTARPASALQHPSAPR